MIKKISKQELLEVLKNKGSKSFRELSYETGYHEKSLVRLSQQLKNDKFHVEHQSKGRKPNNYIATDIREDIISLYKENYDSTYRDIFKQVEDKYHVSYAFVCRLLNQIKNKTDEEILIVSKYRTVEHDYYFAVDYQHEAILMISSLKAETNDMILSMLKNIITKYGAVDNIIFNGLFEEVPLFIKKILFKFNINVKEKTKDIHEIILAKNKMIRKLDNKAVHNIYNFTNISYRKAEVNKEDFYYYTECKLISNNVFDFSRKRYKIISNSIIPIGDYVEVYYSNSRRELYVIYKDKKYQVEDLNLVKA